MTAGGMPWKPYETGRGFVPVRAAIRAALLHVSLSRDSRYAMSCKVADKFQNACRHMTTVSAPVGSCQQPTRVVVAGRRYACTHHITARPARTGARRSWAAR